MTTSSISSAPRSARMPPGASVGLPLARSSAGYSTSCTSVDLPEPLTPVTHTSRCSGIVDVHALEIVLGDAAQAVDAPAAAGAIGRGGAGIRLRTATRRRPNR